jgi:hypothetical protein
VAVVRERLRVEERGLAFDERAIRVELGESLAEREVGRRMTECFGNPSSVRLTINP